MDKRTSFLNKIVSDPHDDAPRLALAGWLEEHGDPNFAKYIRARCALDGKPPAPDDYPTLVEQHLEGHRREPDFKLPPGFELGCWWSGDSHEWWSDSSDAMEGGLLSLVQVEPDGSDEDAAKLLIERLPELIRTTPVRGIDFDGHFAKQMAAVLSSPGAQHLKRLAFDNNHEGDARQASLAIRALGASPLARTLVRLELGGGPRGTLSNADAKALAAAPFEQLQRLDVLFTDCSRQMIEHLLNAPWFRRLQRLMIGFNPPCGMVGARLLAGMPNLHTLGLWMPPDSAVLALARAGEFPDLRRLFIHCASLREKCGAALGRMKAPRLIELWLRNSAVGKGDVPALAATPLFDDLRVLTFDGTDVNEAGLDAIAARPCAAKLRILRISGLDNKANFRSLAGTPLTRPGAFPALSTLELSHPHGKKVKKPDTAEFLTRLAAPNLRHLTLEYCNFDDACASAMATNPAYAGLTRLIIRRGELSTKAARKLFQSENLRNLIELNVDLPLGEGADVLADAAVLPHLARCSLSGVPEKVAGKLKKKRPMVYCSCY